MQVRISEHAYDRELALARRNTYRMTLRHIQRTAQFAEKRPTLFSRADLILDIMSGGKFGVREAIALTERNK